MSSTNGRTSTATLLQVKDKLILYDENQYILASINLRPFPFIKEYASNITLEGAICYAYNIQQFQSRCQTALPKLNTTWIVATPFDFKYTNELLNEAKDNNITGVIIIFDTPIDAAGYYSNPKLISLASSTEGEIIKAYAYPSREGTSGVLEHQYLTNCQLVKSIQIYYIILTTAYLVISFGWVIIVWTLYDEHSTTLQRAFLAVPTLKFLQVFIYGIYVGECPWVNQIQARYMMMALVTISTIYQTVYIALILLVSKGWNVARNTLSRNDLSSITLLMGAVYLTYSAYYVSINIAGMKMFIGFVLNLLYFVLFIVVIKNTLDTRAGLKQQFSLVRANEVRSLLDCIKLKLKMMNQFFVIAVIYFLWELIVNGIIPTFNQDQDQFDPYANVMQQFFDLSIITCLLFIFRSRVWPEYFGVNLLEGQGNDYDNGLEVEERRIAPLLQTNINEKIFYSGKSVHSSEFNSHDPVVIMNPMDYYQRDNSLDNEYYENANEALSEGMGSSLMENSTNERSQNQVQASSNQHKQQQQNPQLNQQKSIISTVEGWQSIYSNLKVGLKVKSNKGNYE